MVRRIAATATAIAMAASLPLACREPTEMKVRVTTDFDCARLAQNEVSVRLGEAVTGAASTVSRTCKDRYVGTVVLTRSDRGDRVTVEVMAALSPAALAQDGTCPEGTSGCIHARRSLSFLDHTPLPVPITLQQSCAGITCNPQETCVDGACVPAAIDSSQCHGDCVLQGRPDAGAGADAGADSAGVGGSLAHGDFEDGAHCTGWSGDGISLTRDPLAHSGQASCRICATTAQSISFRPNAGPYIVSHAGETYVLSAWLHAAPDAGAPLGMQAVIAVSDENGELNESLYGSSVTPTDTWQRVSVTFTLQYGGPIFDTYFVGTETWDVGQCFLVDDAEVERVE